MNLRSFFFLTAFYLLIAGCGNNINRTVNSDSELKGQKPNILFIHIDDLGFHDLSTHGSKIYQTPNIDKLASESIQFENAYANFPRCVPSRYAMVTGTYPIVNGKVPDDGFNISSIPESENLIKKIDAAGYNTAYLGKWHLGDGSSGPEAFGFDTSLAAGEAGSPISYFYPFNEPSKPYAKANKPPMLDLDSIGKEGDYLTDLLTTQMIEYIKRQKSSEPFMAVLAMYSVHQPIEAPEADIKRNREEISNFDFGNQPEYIKEGTGRTKMRQDNPVYAGMVENTDQNIGRILQTLQELNLDENTIVIFSSDHGGLSNDGLKERHLATSNYPLRAGKGWLYEGGIKVPLFIRWKNHFQPRKEEESKVLLMDIFPTILDIVSNQTIRNIDGKSLLPVIKENENWENRTIYWHSDKARPRNTGESNASAIRQGKWKLVDFYEEGRKELYNLENDLGETNNLAEKYPVIVEGLSKKLDEWKEDSKNEN